MRLNEVTYNEAMPVDGYGPGFFRLGGAVHHGAILLLPTGIHAWGGYDDLQPLLDVAGDIDVVLVGTGEQIAHVPPAMRQSLEDAGMGIEPMASAQACRTYNVLLGEGRRIALAALPV